MIGLMQMMLEMLLGMKQLLLLQLVHLQLLRLITHLHLLTERLQLPCMVELNASAGHDGWGALRDLGQ